MKLANKFILFPTLIIAAIFALGISTLEAQITQRLQSHLKDELKALSTISLVAAKLIKKTDPQEYKAQLNYLATQIANANHASVHYFDINGEKITESDNLFNNKKININNILQQNTQLSYIYQAYTEQTWVLLTRLDPQQALISQVALPQNYYSNTLLDIRWGISLIGLITLLASLLFALIAIRFIYRIIQRERNHLEQQISARTKEITLIQAMVTMVNSANSLKNAAIIVENILPRLLPNYSGALYLLKVPEKKLTLFTYWGDKTFKGIQAQLKSDEDKTLFELEFPPCFEYKEAFKKQSLQISLKNNKGYFGVAFFFNKKTAIDASAKATIQQLTKHLNDALANILLTDQLRNQATKDPLTNLYNRRFMQEFLAKVVHRAERHQGCVAVLMIDLDHFKAFNDKFGHEAGDLILATVAQELMNNIRLEDIACRYGGEEFCIICPDTQLDDAYHLAEKLRIKISQLSIKYQHKLVDNITMSVGVAVYPNHAPSCQVLIVKADQALYQAKAQGRNCTVVITDDMGENNLTVN